MDDGAWEIQPALTPPSITISSTLFLVWITDINENKLNKYIFIYLFMLLSIYARSFIDSALSVSRIGSNA